MTNGLNDKGIFKNIQKKINDKGALCFMQIDPPKFKPEDAGKIAKIAEDNGFDAFAVGGSIGAQGKLLVDTIDEIKANSSLPTILFPGNIATLSHNADAIYFMSMLNSLDPYYISGAQTAAAEPTMRMNLEIIPTAYIIVEPGQAVGYIGKAKLIPRNIPYLAAMTALAGQYMGSKLTILESGGGADSPAPPKMIQATKKLTDIPLLVAGGIRNEKFAEDTVAAGADIIQVGTAIENASQISWKSVEETFSKITSAAQRGVKRRN